MAPSAQKRTKQTKTKTIQKKQKKEVQSRDDLSDSLSDADSWSLSSDPSDWATFGQPEEAREMIASLQNILESAESKDDFWGIFERNVKKEEKRLLGLIDEYKKQFEAEDEEFKSLFAELMAPALAPTGVETSMSTDILSGDPTSEHHPLYALSRSLVEQSKALVDEYDRVIQYANNLKLPEDPRPVIEKDYEEVRRIIAMGRRASEAQIEKSLASSEKGKKRRREKSSAFVEGGVGAKCTKFEDDAHLQAMLKMGREELEKADGEKKEVYGWGKAATRAQKAMKALVKVLPNEDV
ncbi:60S ribosomal protein L15 [Paecilomyces lecythidis]|uniref:60S ribosomal protein L15 n=1 Tax=Paecilomyces lecythidis TaxID=3004212 RepID=A0ABR3Y0Y3_9EURO